MNDLPAILKRDTAEIHERVERLPFFQALRTHELQTLSIVGFMRCLAIVHAVVERLSSASRTPPVEAVWRVTMPKLPLLTSDLTGLGAEALPSITPAIVQAIELGGELLKLSIDPVALIGFLYVLEGSQNGATYLKQELARGLDVEPEKLTYFGCYGQATSATWQSFVSLLGSLELSAEEKAVAVRSAVTCFAGIERIVSALHPFDEKDVRYHVAAVNIEAGDHLVPQDPDEIVLALRAGRTAWEKFPYLEARFGDRGRRFTSSDSCWLVGLHDFPADVVTKNLVWLRTVLASRGLPTIILERHLETIVRELGASRAASYQPFLASLRTERASYMSADVLESITSEHERLFRACSGYRIEPAAELIVSAWIDERAGIAGALASTRAWFGDPGRFSSDWTGTVDRLVGALC
ncbi:MAG: biliverdin-producing heme oxygenase [Thermoanaerobaculia bacterium]